MCDLRTKKLKGRDDSEKLNYRRLTCAATVDVITHSLPIIDGVMSDTEGKQASAATTDSAASAPGPRFLLVDRRKKKVNNSRRPFAQMVLNAEDSSDKEEKEETLGGV
ncbi:MAG: hypothetical protein ABJQ90_18780 [Parasphingorhabdus sp.]